MPAKAGERARESGTFHCVDCDEKHYVEKGDEIPPCSCGRNEYDRRTNEPESR